MIKSYSSAEWNDRSCSLGSGHVLAIAIVIDSKTRLCANLSYRTMIYLQ